MRVQMLARSGLELYVVARLSLLPLFPSLTLVFSSFLSLSLYLSFSFSLSLFPVFCVAGDTGNKKEACPPPPSSPRMFKRGPRSRARNQLLGNDFLSRTAMKLLVLSQRPLRSLRIVSGTRCFFSLFSFFCIVSSEHPAIQR